MACTSGIPLAALSACLLGPSLARALVQVLVIRLGRAMGSETAAWSSGAQSVCVLETALDRVRACRLVALWEVQLVQESAARSGHVTGWAMAALSWDARLVWVKGSRTE